MSSDKEKVSERYDRWTPFYDLVDNFPFISGFQKRWKRQAVELLDPTSGDKILDMGTGTGEILPWITESMEDGLLVGTDISEGMISKARSRIDDIEKVPEDLEIKVVKDDIGSSKFSNDYFNKMIATFTFTTVPNMGKAASECARILKPGGMMIILDTGKPKNPFGYPLFYPMMLSAKIFGRTHMDRDVEGTVSKKFEVTRVRQNMLGMVYTLRCEKQK